MYDTTQIRDEVINHSTVTFHSTAKVKRGTKWPERHKLRFKKKISNKMSGELKFMTIGCIIGMSKSYCFTCKTSPKETCLVIKSR